MKRAASESIAQLFLTMGVRDAQKHAVKHHLHCIARHLRRRVEPLDRLLLRRLLHLREHLLVLLLQPVLLLEEFALQIVQHELMRLAHLLALLGNALRLCMSRSRDSVGSRVHGYTHQRCSSAIQQRVVFRGRLHLGSPVGPSCRTTSLRPRTWRGGPMSVTPSPNWPRWPRWPQQSHTNCARAGLYSYLTVITRISKVNRRLFKNSQNLNNTRVFTQRTRKTFITRKAHGQRTQALTGRKLS